VKYKLFEYVAVQNDALIAFWDGKSKGTKYMIDLANSKKLALRIVKY
jgi:hypothetical protein